MVDLTHVFDKIKGVFLHNKPTRRIEQMSWESFVRDARVLMNKGIPDDLVLSNIKTTRVKKTKVTTKNTTTYTQSTLPSLGSRSCSRSSTATTTSTTKTKKTKRKVATTVSSQRKKSVHKFDYYYNKENIYKYSN